MPFFPFRRVFRVLPAVTLSLALFAASAAAVTLEVGERAPGFTLRDLEGNPFTLEQFRGKTVVIAFWSTWCSRCREELAFLRDTFGQRSDVAVLLVNQDSERRVPAGKLRALAEEMGISFPVLLDEGLSLWQTYGINALPTSVVVGEDGLVKLVEPNFYWGSPEKLITATRGG